MRHELLLWDPRALEPVKEIEDGNIPGAILTAVIIIGFAIVMQFCAKEAVELITSQYIDFR